MKKTVVHFDFEDLLGLGFLKLFFALWKIIYWAHVTRDSVPMVIYKASKIDNCTLSLLCTHGASKLSIECSSQICGLILAHKSAK